MPVIQLLAHQGSLPSSSFLKGPELAGTQKNPLYVLFPPCATWVRNSREWSRPNVEEHFHQEEYQRKAEGPQGALMPMITEMPPFQEDDESVVVSRAAVNGLKNTLEETKTDAEEAEEEPPLTGCPYWFVCINRSVGPFCCHF